MLGYAWMHSNVGMHALSFARLAMMMPQPVQQNPAPEIRR
jgi:hypothetical protein